MANTSEGRRQVRAEALAAALEAVRSIRCPEGRRPGWATEFTRGMQSVCRLLENQIAQAEGRVTFRPKGRTKRPPKKA
jgi:hypothetical protein